jgi:hypothetical protein
LCLQKKKDDINEQHAVARKLRELAKTPMPMVLTRVAQILGGFADISAQIATLQAVANAVPSVSARASVASGGADDRGSFSSGAAAVSQDVLHKALDAAERGALAATCILSDLCACVCNLCICI